MSTIRVSDKTHHALRELAVSSGTSMNDVIERAVEAYRRQQIIDQANAQYAALRADPAAWAEVQAERAAWENTLADGLEER
ncbi:MAG: ribbon-helix-helix protein, CopG family [Kouleothrix sp.]|nr:ribbon-helix-helix protein, CopG family [Kouleothrix sp.]